RIIKCGKHSGTPSCSKRRAYDLAAKGPIRPRRHSTPWSGTTFDERSGIAVLVIDIGLVTARLPFRHSIAGNFAEHGCAKLDAAVRRGSFQSNFGLEFKIFRLAALPDEISGTGRMHGDCGVFDVPLWRAVPSFQRGAIEQLQPARVIV